MGNSRDVAEKKNNSMSDFPTKLIKSVFYYDIFSADCYFHGKF